MAQDTSSNNKRIAKNTLLLYVRLLFTIAVGLFTSRVILSTLGIEDYGVYNVVAGVVAMFSLLTGSLSTAISRFLTFTLGKGEQEKLSLVFSTSINIMIGMSFVVILLAELIGVWFLNSHMNIPSERLYAANWVLQFSILTFAMNLISVPYNAAIIAHERMSAFAYISILEVTLKLIIVYMLYMSPFDKLITYAALFAGVAIIIRMVYGFYCTRHFQECRYRFSYDKSLLREMTGFAGWNFFGSASSLLNNQGVNIITNIFFNVTTNAARGIAAQVETIFRQFATNFTTAINPQITKSYAAGNIDYTYSLICSSSKFCYLLMLFFAVPFMFETETIMKLWLGNYPQEAPLFLRLSLVITMIDLLGNSPAIAAWATGDIKRYYIYVGSVVNLMFPLSWIVFAVGMPAHASYLIGIFIYTVTLIVKLYIIKGLIKFSIKRYINEVVTYIVFSTALAFTVPSIFYSLLPKTIYGSILEIAISLIWVTFSIYFVGLTKAERNKTNNLAISKVKVLFNSLKK